MSLLSADDFFGSLTPEQALDRAEALVASVICPQLPDLSVRQWVAEYRIRNDARALGVPLYGVHRLGPPVLRYWPITGLTLVSQDGTNLTDQCAFDTFTVRRDALSPEFLPLSTIRVEFQTGWTAIALPNPIREAILLTARDLMARPQGIVREQLGDVATTYAVEHVQGLPAAAFLLLAPWRFLGS